MSEMICGKLDRCRHSENCPHNKKPPAICYEFEHKRQTYSEWIEKLSRSKRKKDDVNNGRV